MDLQNRRALLTLCLLASRADGERDEREREAVRTALGRIREDGVDPEALWRAVESGELDVARAARELTSPEARELAYEMATCVCDADGATNEKEREFLARLARELGIPGARAETFRREADALAGAPLGASAAGGAGADELDGMILRQAILCGGLELLPGSLSTLAILPLQMRLVYQVGKHHGYELDAGHVKDFLGVLGVGLGSQMIEGFARQLASGLLGRVAGGLIGGLVGRAARPALSFATTYALGHAARRYYAGGRKLQAIELKELFRSLLGQARSVEARHAADVAASARSTDPASLQRLLAR